ncbi:MAG: hypothetical protein WA093_04155 [Minisyncoccales bacterium]
MVNHSEYSSSLFGTIFGSILILVSGMAYLNLLHEPISLFYPFAVFIFIVSPLIGATIASFKVNMHKMWIFFSVGGTVFSLSVILFILIYAIYPQFERTSVQLPIFCQNFRSGEYPSTSFAYELPGVGATTLLVSDSQMVVVAAIDFNTPSYPSTVYLVRKSDNYIVWSMKFENNIISAAIDNGTLFIYNNKLGYWIDIQSGLPEDNFFTIDNYGGLSSVDRPVFVSNISTGRWYMETSAIISMWSKDGSVVSRRRVIFNSIAFNCFIIGITGNVTHI